MVSMMAWFAVDALFCVGGMGVVPRAFSRLVWAWVGVP